MRHAVADRDEAVALGRQLDRVARVDLGQLARVGQVGQEGEAGLAGLLDEDADRGLAALLRRDGLLAGGDEEHLEPVDVALGDPVGRVERERRLVVLAGGAELTELPERLGQAVLGLGVGTELEEPAVRGRGLGPLGGRRLGDRLVGQLPLLAVQVDGALGGGLDVGEGHEAVVLSGRGGVRSGVGGVVGARTRQPWAACFLAPSGRPSNDAGTIAAGAAPASGAAQQQVPGGDDDAEPDQERDPPDPARSRRRDGAVL